MPNVHYMPELIGRSLVGLVLSTTGSILRLHSKFSPNFSRNKRYRDEFCSYYPIFSILFKILLVHSIYITTYNKPITAQSVIMMITTPSICYKSTAFIFVLKRERRQRQICGCLINWFKSETGQGLVFNLSDMQM